jgi:hypothetical protein
MTDGEDCMRGGAARKRVTRTFPSVGAGRYATVDQRVCEQLRQVGRELLDEPVPRSMLNILRAGEDRDD